MDKINFDLSTEAIHEATKAFRLKYPDKTESEIFEMVKRLGPKLVDIVRETRREIQQRVKLAIG